MPDASASPPNAAGHGLLDPQVLTRLMAQPLMSRFPMEGSISGHHRSPHRGSSVEFAEYRNYVPGDDIRRLDWRVFGRTDRFYMKEFEAETNLRCYLVMDFSGSMRFSSQFGTKIDYARRLAATPHTSAERLYAEPIPAGAPTRAIVRSRPTAIERADSMSSTTGTRNPAQNDANKPFSEQWWENERREDARIKSKMNICRGC